MTAREQTEAEAREWLDEDTVRLIRKYGPGLWVDTPGGTRTQYRDGKFRTVPAPKPDAPHDVPRRGR